MNEENADCYCLAGSHCKNDFFVAGSINVPELQIFEKNIIYSPTWTLSQIEGGVTSCDISLRDDKVAFTTGGKRLNILNVGKII
jgi:hypothetical protein